MSNTIKKNCLNCKKVIYPRAADVARGWGKFCNKSCKAKEQERRTHQYSDLLNPLLSLDDIHETALAEATEKW